MMREIFCLDCGLYYVGEQYTTDESAMIHYNSDIWKCPNKECPSYTNDEPAGKMSTDSTGYAYFSEENKELISLFGWSSSKYVPEDVIERYRKSGLTIR